MSTSFDAFQLFEPFFDKLYLFDNLFEPGYIIPVEVNSMECNHDKKTVCVNCAATAFLRFIYFLN